MRLHRQKLSFLLQVVVKWTSLLGCGWSLLSPSLSALGRQALCKLPVSEFTCASVLLCLEDSFPFDFYNLSAPASQDVFKQMIPFPTFRSTANNFRLKRIFSFIFSLSISVVLKQTKASHTSVSPLHFPHLVSGCDRWKDTGQGSHCLHLPHVSALSSLLETLSARKKNPVAQSKAIPAPSAGGWITAVRGTHS